MVTTLPAPGSQASTSRSTSTPPDTTGPGAGAPSRRGRGRSAGGEDDGRLGGVAPVGLVDREQRAVGADDRPGPGADHREAVAGQDLAVGDGRGEPLVDVDPRSEEDTSE